MVDQSRSNTHTTTDALHRYEDAPSVSDAEYLVKRCWKPLLYWAVSNLTSDVQSAEDLVQDAMRAAFNKLQRGADDDNKVKCFENGKAFRAYLRIVARNSWKKEFKRRTRQQSPDSPSENSQVQFDPSDIAAAVEQIDRIVGTLSQYERSVLKAVIIGDRKKDFAARGMGGGAFRTVLEKIRGMLSDLDEPRQPARGRPKGSNEHGAHLAGEPPFDRTPEQLIRDLIVGIVDDAEESGDRDDMSDGDGTEEFGDG